MTSEQMKGWLQWRKDVGLPPVQQSKLNAMLKDARVTVVDNPRKMTMYRKKTYLFGLITLYKAVDQK